MKTNRGILFKKMLAVMTVAAIMAAVGLLGLLPALAHGGASATRSFNPATVAPGGEVVVTIDAANLGVREQSRKRCPPGSATLKAASMTPRSWSPARRPGSPC